jgi:hypothetical protein
VDAAQFDELRGSGLFILAGDVGDAAILVEPRRVAPTFAAPPTSISATAPLAEAGWLFFESSSRSNFFVEHDLFRKPASTFRVML